MRIAVLADFKLDTYRCTQTLARKMCKGLVRNGHDVLPISYRNLMLQKSPWESKTIAQKFAKKKTDHLCGDLLENYEPDIVLILAFRYLDYETIRYLRKSCNHCSFVGFYGDPLDGVSETARKMFPHLDWLVATGAGKHLTSIARSCQVPGAFLPNPCDPDIEKPYPVKKSESCNILFTGKLGHKRCGTDTTRAEYIQNLAQREDMDIYGALGHSQVLGVEYYRRISSAKIAVSINASNDIRFYHSDRLIHYLSCGAFTLAKTIPDANILFEDEKHLRYFSSIPTCQELVQYYLDHHKERQEIAQQGMQHAHQNFNCQRIARDLVNLVTNNTYEEPWAEVVA